MRYLIIKSENNFGSIKINKDYIIHQLRYKNNKIYLSNYYFKNSIISKDIIDDCLIDRESKLINIKNKELSNLFNSDILEIHLLAIDKILKIAKII